jgi:hypothetical protein
MGLHLTDMDIYGLWSCGLTVRSRLLFAASNSVRLVCSLDAKSAAALSRSSLASTAGDQKSTVSVVSAFFWVSYAAGLGLPMDG